MTSRPVRGSISKTGLREAVISDATTVPGIRTQRPGTAKVALCVERAGTEEERGKIECIGIVYLTPDSMFPRTGQSHTAGHTMPLGRVI